MATEETKADGVFATVRPELDFPGDEARRRAVLDALGPAREVADALAALGDRMGRDVLGPRLAGYEAEAEAMGAEQAP